MPPQNQNPIEQNNPVSSTPPVVPAQPSVINTGAMVGILKKKLGVIIVLVVIFSIVIFGYFLSLNNTVPYQGGDIVVPKGDESTGLIPNTFKLTYEKYGTIEDSCVNPVEVVEEKLTRPPATLKWISGGEIFKGKVYDDCKGCPTVFQAVSSFGNNVAYCTSSGLPYTDDDACYYNKTLISNEFFGAQKIFGPNLYQISGQIQGGKRLDTHIFNNGLDACGGQKTNCSCEPNKDGIVCVEHDSNEIFKIVNIYLNGLPLERKFNKVITSKSSSNVALINESPGKSDFNVTLLVADGKLPPMNLGTNPKPLIPIDLGTKIKYIDLGAAFYGVSLFGNHIVFERNTEEYLPSDKSGFQGISTSMHIIYDGIDLGPGTDPVIWGDHLVFKSQYCEAYTPEDSFDQGNDRCKAVLIYDGQVIDIKKDLGLEKAKYFLISEMALFGNHLAFHVFDGNSTKVVYDGKIIGEVSGQAAGEDIVLSGDHVAFFNSDYHVIYDGKDLGEGTNSSVPQIENYDSSNKRTNKYFCRSCCVCSCNL
jgi:hypothetical protein